MRDYIAMRDVLSAIEGAVKTLTFNDFRGVQQRDQVVLELKRLKQDGLISSTLVFDGKVCLEGSVYGLTEEGYDFFNLIKNERVWKLILKTLNAAEIDVSYPLLKEVCEEIVKRYVTSFIPRI